MTRDDAARPLSLDKMAARLGNTDTTRAPTGGRTRRAQELLDDIEAWEAEHGVTVLQRRRRAKRTTLRVTEYALREHMPHLFPGERRRLAVEKRFQRVMSSIDQRIDDRVEQLDQRVTRCERDALVAQEMAAEVGERLDRHIRVGEIGRRLSETAKKSDSSSGDATSAPATFQETVANSDQECGPTIDRGAQARPEAERSRAERGG